VLNRRTLQGPVDPTCGCAPYIVAGAITERVPEFKDDITPEDKKKVCPVLARALSELHRCAL
jgi:hypothetical protein